MSKQATVAASAYAACVPHVPFMNIQARDLNAAFWASYEAQAAQLRRFDPDLVFVFGADHYEGQHLRSMPAFMIGHAAQAVDDCGGFPGRLDVPVEIARACAEFLVDADFDVAISYAMRVDHGFSGVVHHMLGSIDAKPVVPIFVNALSHPRPRFKRCRQLGEAVGRFARSLGKRVAFLGSGGLSHDTSDIFPQVFETQNEALRDFMIHGGAKGELTPERWRTELNAGLAEINKLHEQRTPGLGARKPEWDRMFLRKLTTEGVAAFDAWDDAEILRTAGNGAGEVREWIAALGAAGAAGASRITVDYFEADSCIGVAAAVVHAE